MSFQKHCPGCFADKGGAAVCPVCSYDESATRSPLFLPHGIIIGGQFRVGRVLGHPGGFGITYLGWDIHLQQRVAIKEFLPRDIVTRHSGDITVSTHTQETRSAFEFGKEQFLREARIVAALDHPNVVRVRSFFNANDTAYLVMDYYEGMSLGDYLGRVRSVIEPALAVPLLRPVIDALQYVHENGVVHRDLKPHNIYLASVGKPIVLDFGAARQAAGERVQHSMSVVLTDGYAPLEQYQRRAAQGPWTDVYGVAATLYRMLAGVAPPNALDRLSDDPLEKTGWDGIPHSLRPALRRALALKPEDRFQTAGEFATALSDYRAFVPEPVVIEESSELVAEPSMPPVAHGAAVTASRIEPTLGEPLAAPQTVAAAGSSDVQSPAASAPMQREAGSADVITPTPTPTPSAAAVAAVAAVIEAARAPMYSDADGAAAIDAPPTTRSITERPPAPLREFPLVPPLSPDQDERPETPTAPPPRDGLSPSGRLYAWLSLGVPLLLFVVLLALIGSQWIKPARKPPLSLRSTDTPIASTPAAVGETAPAAAPATAPTAATEAPLLPEMRFIEGGEFQIGENEPGSDAAPAHAVRVASMLIASTEVTVEQFAQFVRLTEYHNPRWKNYPCESAGSRNPSWEEPGFPNSNPRPVVCVSWVDANAYASWLSAATKQSWRLPTEAEWEYAARGRSSSRYWWGDRMEDDKATCSGCATVRTGPQPVRSWPANAYGLYDVASNVREWSCSAGLPYGSGTELACIGADAPGRRAVRGGSWQDPVDALRSAQRAELDPNRRDVRTGFRLVQAAGAARP